MKKSILLLMTVVLAAPVMASAANGNAESGKNPCMLDSHNCASAQSDSIQGKIAKLQNELNKGTAIYTVDELKKLDAKFNEYTSLLTMIMYN